MGMILGLAGPGVVMWLTTHHVSTWLPWITIPQVWQHPLWRRDWADLTVAALIGWGYLLFRTPNAPQSTAHGSARWRTTLSELTADWTAWPQALAKPDPAASPPASPARLALRAEARPVRQPSLPPPGLLVGLMPNRPSTALILTRDQNMLVLGASRSGKTSSLIFETLGILAEHQQSLIISDLKGELYRRTAAHLQNQGYVVIRYDLRQPALGDQNNPLDPLMADFRRERYDHLVQQAWKLVDALVDPLKPGDQPFWRNAKMSLLVALMLYIVSVPLTQDPPNNPHMPTPDAIHLANALQLLSLDDTTLDGLIQSETQNPANPLRMYIQQAYATVAKAPPETRGSIVSDTAAQLRLWSRPDIAWLTSRTTPWQELPKMPPGADHTSPPQAEGPFAWADLGNRDKPPVAIFLVVPHNDSTPLPIGTIFLTQMLQALGDTAVQAPQGRLSRQVNFILDEFGNFPPIPDMDKVASLGLGQGIRLMLIVQDYSQIEKNYEEKAAQTLISNCGTQIYLKTNESASAERFSRLLGDSTLSEQSTSQSYGMDTASRQQSRSTSFLGRHLMMPDELMRNPRGTAIVYQEGHFPAKLLLKPIEEWPRYAQAFADRPDSFRDVPVPPTPPVWPTTQLDEVETPTLSESLEALYEALPADQWHPCASPEDLDDLLIEIDGEDVTFSLRP
jgi:type IV secretion system protein VirD4